MKLTSPFGDTVLPNAARRPALRRTFHALLLLGTTLLLACASLRSGEAWLGHPADELLRALGPPDEVLPDGGDGSYIVYRSYRDAGRQVEAASQRSVPLSRETVDTFHANAEGIIDEYNYHRHPSSRW